MGHNELLLRDALRGRDRDRVVLSVKFGLLRAPDGTIVGLDGRPAAVKNSLAYTLRRLGTDHVDIYRLGRVDPAVPIEETVGAIADMIQAGYVRHVGLSEAGSSGRCAAAPATGRRGAGLRVELVAELGSHHPVVALLVDGTADEGFGQVAAVALGGVQQVDASCRARPSSWSTSDWV